MSCYEIHSNQNELTIVNQMYECSFLVLVGDVSRGIKFWLENIFDLSEMSITIVMNQHICVETVFSIDV